MATRIKRAVLASAGLLTILVPTMSLTGFVHDGGSIFDWRVGWAAWGIALLLIPILLLWAERITRALWAKLIVLLSIVPTAVASLHGGFLMAVRILGNSSTSMVAVGLLLGLATLPLTVRSRRKWHQMALKEGHLRSSLDRENAEWDPKNDYAQMASKDWVRRPGFLLRLLPWIGPAIGMSLADIFGRSTANVIMALVFIFLGYSLAYAVIGGALVQFLEFRQLERELGRPILLVEEAANT